MTWEEIIIDIRKNPDYSELVHAAYFGEDIVDCVERYKRSDEFLEILEYINSFFKSNDITILDLGAGNGISSIAFTLNGFKVIALEPDKSDTVGAGAIQLLKENYNLSKIEIISCFAEDMPYEENTFDIVFARQAMHHAYNLESFVKQSARVLKKGGLFFTVRDHVVNDEAQKQLFLQQHPLHKFYGGENAFSFAQYTNAMERAGLLLLKSLGPYDSVINYFPETITSMMEKFRKKFKIPFPIPLFIFKGFLFLRKVLTNNYRNQPGRLYSFIAVKK